MTTKPVIPKNTKPVVGLETEPVDMSTVRVGDLPADPTAEVKFKLAKVGVRVCAEPFYAPLWIALRPQFSHIAGTAWVDFRGGVFFNPDFLGKLTLTASVGVALHEILHEVLMHIPRTLRLFGPKPTAEQLKAGNYAADAIVNDMLLRKFLPTLPAGAFTLPAGAVLLEDGFVDDKTFEELVRLVLDAADEVPGYDQFQPDWRMPEPGESPGETGDTSGESPGETGDAPGAGQSQAAQDAMRRAMIASAVDHARKIGRLPAGLERHLGDVLEPKKNYHQLLTEALVPLFQAGRDDYSWRRPHRGYRQAGVYAPAIAGKLGIRKAAFWVDTSGSQTQEMVNDCVAEVMRVADDCGIGEVHICYCDTQIHRIDVVELGDTYTPVSAPGGGGTDVQPVFDYAEEIGADAIVCLTDMCVAFPEEPDVPVLWVTTCAQHQTPDYGTVVELYD